MSSLIQNKKTLRSKTTDDAWRLLGYTYLEKDCFYQLKIKITGKYWGGNNAKIYEEDILANVSENQINFVDRNLIKNTISNAEISITTGYGASRGYRGGNYSSNEIGASVKFTEDPKTSLNTLGFRVASLGNPLNRHNMIVVSDPANTPSRYGNNTTVTGAGQVCYSYYIDKYPVKIGRAHV